MDISIKDLSYFLAVADAGNVAVAASNCHVTQPALSKAIQRVEDAVELQLFIRSKSGMALTASGEMFRDHALRIRREYEDAMRHAADLRDGSAGLLRVGATRPIYDFMVAPVVADLLRQRPQLIVRLELGSSTTELVKLLLQGQIDLVVGPSRATMRADLTFTALGTNELVVVAAAAHPAFSLPHPDLSDLTPWRWILPKKDTSATQWFVECHHEQGLRPPSPALEIDYAGFATLGIVARSDLLLLAPVGSWQSGLPETVKRLPVACVDSARPVYLIQRSDAYRSAVMTEMCRLLTASSPGS